MCVVPMIGERFVSNLLGIPFLSHVYWTSRHAPALAVAAQIICRRCRIQDDVATVSVVRAELVDLVIFESTSLAIEKSVDQLAPTADDMSMQYVRSVAGFLVYTIIDVS